MVMMGTSTPALYREAYWRDGANDGFVCFPAVHAAESSHGSAGLVGGEPHGYDAQRPQTEAQPRDGTPCTDLNATALAHTIAIELCAAG